MAPKDSHTTFDKSQFEELFRVYFVPLSNFAKSYVNDLEAAKGITQEVFVNIWEKRATIDPNKPLKSYLFSSVKNRCLNYIRDHKKFSSQLLDTEIANFETPFEQDGIEISELQEKIDKAIHNLPEKLKRVFLLSRFEELKYREIAEKLDISQKTVEAQMSKALKILREELKDYIFLLLLLLLK